MLFKNKNKMNTIIQEEISECGLACLTMILNYYGKKYSLNYMRDNHYSSINGFNFIDILNIAKKEELIALPFNIEKEDFKDLKTPCIAHLNENHFVIIKEIKKNKVIIFDPLLGKVKYTISDFFDVFSFNVIEFEKEEGFKESKGDEEELKKYNNVFNFVKNVDGFWKNTFRILIISFSLEFFILVSPFFYKLIIDNIIIENNKDMLIPVGISFLFISVFKSLSEWFRKNMILFLSNNLEKNIKYGLIYKLLKLPVSFFQKRGINNVISKINSFEDIKDKLTKGIIHSIMDSYTVIATGLFMLYISPSLFSIVILFIALISIFKYLNTIKLKEKLKNKVESIYNEDLFITNTLKNIETTKAHGDEDFIFKKWYSFYVKYSNENTNIEKSKININTIEDLLINFQRIIVIWLGSTFVINSQISFGFLVVFFAYQIIFSQQLLNLISNIIDLKLLNIHLENFNEIKQQKEEDNKIGNIDYNINGDIELKNIFFKYEDNAEYIFKDFSAIIKHGESVLIRGNSGSGKSTLLKIISGLLPIESGEILINGFNIKEIGLNNYRKNISFIFQNEQILTDGSIADNITNFKSNYNTENVIESAKKSCIHNYINTLNMSYDTKINEISNTLSGGQIQRILIAKSLYRNPCVLFMDEGLNFLNKELKNKIIDNISNEKITKIYVIEDSYIEDKVDKVIYLNNEEYHEKS